MLKISSFRHILVLAVLFFSFLAKPIVGHTAEIPLFDRCEILENCPDNDLYLSHTEGKGLGYNQGYTSLDLFLTLPLCNCRFIPFIDLKGHVFNNGRFATNTGLGLRWLNPCYERAWGLFCFYDSYISSRLSCHQVSLGFESLGETWDLRVNGYLPVGHKKTSIYRLSYDFSSGFLARAREQFAMAGIDAEIGYHFCRMQYFDFYAGIGPYFYRGSSQKTKNAFRVTRKNAFGGRLRASAAFLTYLELEGVLSYDSLFKCTGQVSLSLNIPFDWQFGFGCSDNDCCAPCGFMQRLTQPIIRNEIIVIDKINRFSTNPLILDPEFEP